MFWSLTGGFVVGQANEIAGMLRAFIRDTGIRMNYSAWYNRLAKEEFSEFMRKIAMHLINHVYMHYLTSQGLLETFQDVNIQDGSSLVINDRLKNIFPGRFSATSPAAIELHAFFSLRYASFHGVTLAPDVVSEYKFMPKSGEYDLRNTLNLFDRGYNSLDDLHVIEQEEGCFLVRWRSNTTPRILWVNHQGKDQRKDGYFKNEQFKNIRLNRGENYDFAVAFNNKTTFHCLRLIALWNPVTREHILFLTNADTKKLPLATIGQVYRLRWQIELIFKELKSFSELRKFLTGNANIVQGLIWTAFCALLIRRFLVASAQQFTDLRLSFHKAASSARTFMPSFIRCALDKFSHLHQCLLDIFDYVASTMLFSNRHRRSSFLLAGVVIRKQTA